MATRVVQVRARARQGLGLGSLITFFAFSFGITWGLGLLALLAPEVVGAWFGEFGPSNPLFILAVYAPAFTGVVLVWRAYGLRGVGSFLRRLALWRMPFAWWAGLVVGIPAVYYLAAVIGGTLTGTFPFSPWHTVLPALGFALLLGPVEEFGWRGLALPLLQRRMAPLWAGLVLGVVWIVWHLPAFFIGGTPQSEFAFVWFFLGGVAISVIMTAMFNAARGSLLVMALFHWQLNNPIWPDGMAWAAILFILVAAVVVLLRREAMLTRAGAVTEVLHPDDAARTKGPRYA